MANQRQTTTASAQWIEFLSELMRLKALPRTGWLLRGVREVESVAAHSFGTAFIAMLLADRMRELGQPVNVELVLRMALLHDLTEARTGDLPATIKPYFENATLQAADERIATDVLAPLGETGETYQKVWRTYEQRASLEARLVKVADKLDLLLQAYEYEKGGARGLDEFWENSATDFSGLALDELLTELIDELKQRRDAIKNGLA